MNIPNYEDINLEEHKLLCGFYSLGIIETYFHKLKVINACEWRKHKSGDRYGGRGYKWLHDEINTNLKLNKIVLVIPEDEDVMYPSDPKFTKVLNNHATDDVYLVTQMPDFGIYIDAGITCKILELPWMMVNDCLCFHSVVNKYKHTASPSKYNFISFIGRNQEHKMSVFEHLCLYNLDQYGLLTMLGENDLHSLPPSIRNKVSINEIPPYIDYEKSKNYTHELYHDGIYGFKEGGFSKICNIWVSANVENFLKIKELYHDVPLVVHAETTTGVFPMTEKSVWPILLGKMFLIHGHQGVMYEIQQFYDIDISDFANIEFDSFHGWGVDNDNIRLDKMIVDNKSLIENASEKYKELKPQLDKSSYTFGKNMYNFFIKQLTTLTG
ncbi:MAG: hypothetical protein HN982_00200 [Candidatus Marinimicrobia bacterium]|jgi:hypothetical protein|nr:hypothetical protein [Candidatus Neomarinimicrobiota bacterium]